MTKQSSKREQVRVALLAIEPGKRVTFGRFNSLALDPALEIASAATVRKVLEELSDGDAAEFETNRYSAKRSWVRLTDERKAELAKRAARWERECETVETLRALGVQADHGRGYSVQIPVEVARNLATILQAAQALTIQAAQDEE